MQESEVSDNVSGSDEVNQVKDVCSGEVSSTSIEDNSELEGKDEKSVGKASIASSIDVGSVSSNKVVDSDLQSEDVSNSNGEDSGAVEDVASCIFSHSLGKQERSTSEEVTSVQDFTMSCDKEKSDDSISEAHDSEIGDSGYLPNCFEEPGSAMEVKDLQSDIVSHEPSENDESVSENGVSNIKACDEESRVSQSTEVHHKEDSKGEAIEKTDESMGENILDLNEPLQSEQGGENSAAEVTQSDTVDGEDSQEEKNMDSDTDQQNVEETSEVNDQQDEETTDAITARQGGEEISPDTGGQDKEQTSAVTDGQDEEKLDAAMDGQNEAETDAITYGHVRELDEEKSCNVTDTDRTTDEPEEEMETDESKVSEEPNRMKQDNEVCSNGFIQPLTN